MKVHVVTITPEDGEVYKYAFYQKPSDTKVKGYFFRDYGHTYKKRDWGICISYEIEELDIYT